MQRFTLTTHARSFRWPSHPLHRPGTMKGDFTCTISPRDLPGTLAEVTGDDLHATVASVIRDACPGSDLNIDSIVNMILVNPAKVEVEVGFGTDVLTVLPLKED